MANTIRDAVLADVETKIAAGEALAAANEAVGRAQEALNEANAEAARARQSAVKSGWSEAELKKLGLVPNTRSARARSSRSRAASESTGEAADSEL